MALRALRAGEVPDRAASLTLRPEGRHPAVWDAHVEALADLELPAGWADPWLAARVGLEHEDRNAGMRLAWWSIWDPDPDRRAHLVDLLEERFGVRACPEARCLEEAAEALLDDEGVGRRDARTDAAYVARTGVERAGVAGDWLGAWREWAGPEPVEGVVRMGIGADPASALWAGGTEDGRVGIAYELGWSDRPPRWATVEAPDVEPGPGTRAAAIIPW